MKENKVMRQVKQRHLLKLSFLFMYIFFFKKGTNYMIYLNNDNKDQW